MDAFAPEWRYFIEKTGGRAVRSSRQAIVLQSVGHYQVRCMYGEVVYGDLLENFLCEDYFGRFALGKHQRLTVAVVHEHVASFVQRGIS